MVDFVTVWSPDTLSGDWAILPPSLESDADLDTAVIISLFTDRLANPDDPIPDANGSVTPDRRGWWGDQAPTVNDSGTATVDNRIGSRLWLLTREKRLPKVLQDARTYAEEALQWLIDDGVAAAVDVSSSWAAPSGNGFDRLNLIITITRNDGSVVTQQYDWAWQQLGASNAA